MLSRRQLQGFVGVCIVGVAGGDSVEYFESGINLQAKATCLRHRFVLVKRRFRQARMIAKSLKSRHHPVDRLSQFAAVISPAHTAMNSIAYPRQFQPQKCSPGSTFWQHWKRPSLRLAAWRPLLHPDRGEIMQTIRNHGILAGLITNGYPSTRERIKAFEPAGLDQLQISIDNVITR